MASGTMNLAFSGAPEIHATRDEVWRRLLDPDFIGYSAPGVEAVERVDATRFRMILGFGVALLKLRFALDVEMYDIVEGRSARMRASGHAPGSDVEMLSSIRIEDATAGRVRLHWDAASRLTGAVTGIGSRLMETVARKLTAQFWQNFADRVARETAAARR